MDGYIETGVITSEQVEDASNELHQHTHNTLGETSSEENVTALKIVQRAINRRNLEKVESFVSEVEQSPLLGVASKSAPTAAAIVAGVPGKNPDISSWKNTARPDISDGTMIAFQSLYSKLKTDIKRCFDYCSIFPRRSKLRRVDLVCMWTAQGLVKARCATEDMEDVADGYIQTLVSHSFLQREGTSSEIDCFTIPDLIHDFLDEVIGSDYFRIENGRGQRRQRWKEEVPHDVRHLFVQNYDAKLITEKILGLEKLRTLIIYVVERGKTVEKEMIVNICNRLPKLRVLAIAFSRKHVPIEQPKFLVPDSISQLKRLSYLALRTCYSCTVILPSLPAEIYPIQLLDFGDGKILEFTFADLINLRHIFCGDMEFSNMGRLVALQMLPHFRVSNEQGYEIKQLRDLNKLCGSLVISGLENINSKEEALEANLAAKECLTHVTLSWGCDTRCSQEVGGEVLEGLCPPAGLVKLNIWGYRGSSFPEWLMGKQKDGPKDLQTLGFSFCSQLGPGPVLKVFPHLRSLFIAFCSWDTLPGNLKYLTRLKELEIINCMNIRSLPTLPHSIKEFRVYHCYDEFMKNCQTVGHPNWQKIEHIPGKIFKFPVKKDGDDFAESDGIASHDSDVIASQNSDEIASQESHDSDGTTSQNSDDSNDIAALPVYFNEQGDEIKQRDLIKLQGTLSIEGLENVKSKEEALEANLAAQEQLRQLRLKWDGDNNTRCSRKVDAEVLEGLCPPLGLEALVICNYRGLRYPDWMVGKQNGGPKDLKKLGLICWFQPGPAPALGAFIHLRVLLLESCSWDALSINIEYLASLESLEIFDCPNIRSLPTLPQSLQKISIRSCNDAFLKSCERVGHPNWQKIEHVPTKKISKT